MKLLIFLFMFIAGSGACLAQSDTLKTASGLKYVYLKKGEGIKIKKGDKVKVHYSGQLQDGVVFDSSKPEKPFSVKAGGGRLIEGWDEVLLLLKGDDAIKVWIPAKLAYGSEGYEDPTAASGYLIPPNSPLIFKIQVVEVKQ